MSKPFVPIKPAEIGWHHDQPFSLQHDDVYYSAGNGIEHCKHVFIEGNNLINRWQALPDNQFEVFTLAETGFGTGLNFLVTWYLWKQYAPPSARLHYISCELHPLQFGDLVAALSNWPLLAKEAEALINQYPTLTPGYHHLSFDGGRVQLTLMLGDVIESYEQLLICGSPDLERSLRKRYIDAWYLDGFAPSKNADMWSEDLFKIMALLSKEGSTVATYTAASTVKTHLNMHGFTLTKRKGFGPKRHMIAAHYTGHAPLKRKQRHTPWHSSDQNPPSTKKAVIIGAGLAGCFTAYELAKRGWNVTLIEEQSTLAQGASANTQAVLFPKLSAYKQPLTEFMLSAFIYAARIYKDLLQEEHLGELEGSLLLAHNKKEQAAQNHLKEWLSSYPELGILVSAEEASNLTGLFLEQNGLYIPESGWINTPQLCALLTRNELITVLPNTAVEELVLNKNTWTVNQIETEVLILANGYKLGHFSQTSELPIKSIRGQMTAIMPTQESGALKIPLCAEGHVLPASYGVHTLGATYGLGESDSATRIEDDALNLSKLARLAPKTSWQSDAINHWAGIRATTPDYLPLVGPIPIAEHFKTIFAGLETNSKRWIPSAGPYYPGLYACAGFGSKGLTTVPLCAQWLASLINNELSSVPRSLIQSLSPARFLKRSISRGLS